MSPRAEKFRRAVRWFVPAAALALTPKCLVCVLAYAGLGAALGLGGPELCGAPAGSTGSGASLLAVSGAIVSIGMIGFLASHRCRRTPLSPSVAVTVSSRTRFGRAEVARETIFPAPIAQARR